MIKLAQKVNPNGLRLGINKDWQAKWYAKSTDFGRLLNNDIKIRQYIFKKFKDAGISTVLVERNKKRTEVFINTAKPGLIIGQSGESVEKAKKALSKMVNEDVQLSIVEVKQPDMVAQLVADSIAHQLENRVSFRIAQKRALRNTMKAGAKGIKTLVSGRLGGADIARSEGYTEGTIPLHTIRADIDYATSEADTTFGKIGVKVWIYKGEILPAKKNMGGSINVNTKKN